MIPTTANLSHYVSILAAVSGIMICVTRYIGFVIYLFKLQMLLTVFLLLTPEKQFGLQMIVCLRMLHCDLIKYNLKGLIPLVPFIVKFMFKRAEVAS